MTVHFNDFHEDINCVVIGASGGIGGAAVNALANHRQVGRVYAMGRATVGGAAANVESVNIDLLEETSVESAASRVAGDGPVDLVFVATGILHDGNGIQPEKRLRDIDPATMSRVFAINMVGPALLAKHFLPILRRGHRNVFASLSARVGSIGDNRKGGWISYRASKAALNMVLKTAAIEQARRNKDSVVVALHPGTVDTRLSSPFQANVPAGQLFSPETSVAHLLDVIVGLQPEDSGGFFAWDGQRIDY